MNLFAFNNISEQCYRSSEQYSDVAELLIALACIKPQYSGEQQLLLLLGAAPLYFFLDLKTAPGISKPNPILNMSTGNHGIPPRDEAPPPYSETDIYSQSGARSNAGSSQHPGDESLTSSEAIYTPPLTPGAFASINNQGAAHYIDSRPAPSQCPPTHISHAITFTEESIAEDFPYINSWGSRDVSPQDWATFVNFLLPDHTTRGNEVVIDRKLRAEAESQSGESNRSEAESHLESLRERSIHLTQEDLAERQATAAASTLQWNQGFFGPRNMEVRLITQPGVSVMPGSWQAAFDQNTGDAVRGEAPRPGPSNPSNNSSFPFVVDAEGIRWGNTFVADSRGLRIGKLIMDNEGIRWGEDGPPLVPSNNRSVPLDTKNDATGSSQERGRGLNAGAFPERRRDRSSSSDSSSSSESSIGSLPDYDDVKPQQMPTYIAILQDLTQHPQKFRSKSEINTYKTAIKGAKSAALPQQMDKTIMKAQLKSLATSWRQIKREQKKLRREEKKVRRKQRRAERKEYRKNKREMKRAVKENPFGFRPNVPFPPPPPQPLQPGTVPPLPGHGPWPSPSPWNWGGRGGGRAWGGHRGGWGSNGNCNSWSQSGNRGLFNSALPSGNREAFNTAPLQPGRSFDAGPLQPGRAINTAPLRSGGPGAWPVEPLPHPRLPNPQSIAAAARQEAVVNLQAEIDKQLDGIENLLDGPEKRARQKAVEAMTESLNRLQMFDEE